MAKAIDGLSKQAKKEGDETPEVVVEEAKADASTETETKEVSPEPAQEEPVTEDKKPEEAPTEAKAEESPATETTAETPEVKPETTETPPADPEKTPEISATPDAETPAKADGFDLFPEPSVVVSGPPTWLWWLLLVAGAATLGFLAYDLTRGRIDTWLSTDTASTPTPEVSATPTPTSETSTPTPTPTASASPTTTVVKSSVTLRVLNGTTQAGAAAATKTKLEAAGFTVKSIGNAKNQNYVKTFVYYQKDKKAEGEAVFAALGDDTATLEESTLANPDMVLVVFGK